MAKKALIIGGGAPNLTLMTGALCAFEEKGVKFDVYSTSGAGSLVGLLAVAPKGKKPAEALRDSVRMGVDNWINAPFPVNYKVFEKPGFLADFYRKGVSENPFAKFIFDQQGKTDMNRFVSDWVQLGLAMFCPSSLSSMSKGMCAHAPWIEEVVDFDELKKCKFHFYINAYNITEHKMENWGIKDIDAEHFKASLSFPFIYPPTRIGENLYIEGAVVDCLNYKFLVNDSEKDEVPGKHTDLETLVIFDVLGMDKLLREPRDLYDAWVTSIIAPLVAVAQDDTKIFEKYHNVDKDGNQKRKLLKIQFDIPDDYMPNVTDWSFSNMETLFKIGHDSGLKFYEENRSLLVP